MKHEVMYSKCCSCGSVTGCSDNSRMQQKIECKDCLMKFCPMPTTEEVSHSICGYCVLEVKNAKGKNVRKKGGSH